MKKSKRVLIGCLEETADTLHAFLKRGGSLDHIIALPKTEAERAKITNYVDMGKLAEDYQIPYSYCQSYAMDTSEDANLIKEINPDLVFVVGWQRLVPKMILDKVRLGAIGFHGSANFLPWGRGRSPINWSIIEGRDRFILHMFYISPGVDDGEIIGMKVYDINPFDTCRSVYYKTAIAQAELMIIYLPFIESGISLRYPQIGSEYYYKRRYAEDGKIDWNKDFHTITRLIRAVTRPYPGAFATRKDQSKIMIWNAQIFSDDFFQDAKPGEVVFVSSGKMKEFIVKCGQGSILVTEADYSEDIKVGEILL